MSMKKVIKQAMLQHGGYALARKLYQGIENHGLAGKYLKFIEKGNASLPRNVMFEPTQRCNLKCKMCFQNRARISKAEELSCAQITEFFDRNPFLQKITLIGGELFCRHDILELIGYLNQSRRDIVICTNGTLIGENEVNTLRQCDNVYTVCISLDGPKDVHESIRGVKGSFDKVVSTIKTLVRIFPITVNIVIQDENIKHIPDMIDLCASLHVNKLKIEMERIYSPDRIRRTIENIGIVSSDLPFPPEERSRGYSLETLKNILSECLKRGKRAGIDVLIDPPYLRDNLRACYDNNLLNSKKFICQIMDTATITPNGDVVNCIHIKKSFGNILDMPFEEIWNSNRANLFRTEMLRNNLTPLCENCPFMIPASSKIVQKIARKYT